jgi:hypothetical protein
MVWHSDHRLAASGASLPDRIKHCHRITPPIAIVVPAAFSAQEGKMVTRGAHLDSTAAGVLNSGDQ